MRMQVGEDHVSDVTKEVGVKQKNPSAHREHVGYTLMFYGREPWISTSDNDDWL